MRSARAGDAARAAAVVAAVVASLAAVLTLAPVVPGARAGLPEEALRAGAPLVVRISGVEPAGTGPVRANLYMSREAYPGAWDVQVEARMDADGDALAVFDDLPPGGYAVIIYQDVNGNGRLDRGAFGVPLEPVGFSNGVVPRFSRPAFGDLEIRHDGAPSEIGIRLIRLA